MNMLKKCQLEAKLLAKTNITKTCWLWEGVKNPDGYGRILIGKLRFNAHRIMYEIHNGKFDKKLNVLHSCDVRNCINPSHLFLGTQYDNIQDIYKKGRGNKQGNARINLEIAEKIRELVRQGYSQKSLIGFYNLDSSQISRIVNNVIWRKEVHS